MQIFCHWFHWWMIDPIFAAPRRQEGFASEKQKLLEDCRRRLSKMATFSKRWTRCVCCCKNHCRQQIHDQQSELLTQVKARENRVTLAYPICWFVCWDLHQAQLHGEAVGSGPNVKLQYTMKLSKSCLAPLLFTKLHWLMSGKRPDVQVPTKERSWVGATWHLFQFPSGQLVEWIWKYCQHE